MRQQLLVLRMGGVGGLPDSPLFQVGGWRVQHAASRCRCGDGKARSCCAAAWRCVLRHMAIRVRGGCARWPQKH